MRYHHDTSAFQIQPLEPRMLLAATPAGVLTKAMRQNLLDNLTISVKSQLQTKLNTNDLAGFDQQLLTYMSNRTEGQFYFQPSDVPDYVSFLDSNLNTNDVIARADNILANLYPLQDEASSSLTLPADVDWTYTGYSTNPETIHTLNRQAFWVDLAMAYRLDGNGAYADKLIGQLADWSSQAPALADPNAWHDQPAPWWRLNAAMRAENWAWSYSLLVGTAKWSKEANTLFLIKSLEHGQFLYSVDSADLTSNQAFLQGKGLLCMSLLFPEFTASSTWTTAAEDLVFDTMDAQFYPDGSHAEQSPGYASIVIRGLLEAELLENANGVTWPDARKQALSDAVDAVYELQTPNAKNPAMSDTYRLNENTLWFHANLVQGVNWPVSKPSSRDVWVFGPDAVAPYIGSPGAPALGARPSTYALPDSGNYIARSGSDANARQLLFDAGPKGGTHGHFDLLNFELFGYGKPLIADPGLYMYDTSASRTWAISTPAHNTISLNNANTGALEGSDNPGIVVDQWDVAGDHVQVTAYHFGYAYLAGKPVVGRSIWYDLDGTMLVVDWVQGAQTVNAKTSFLLPSADFSRNLSEGWMRSINPSGGNVKIQSLLQTGQSASYKTAGIFTSSTPPPNQSDPATQFYMVQSGSFVAFATLITAYSGTTPPNTTAQLLSTPAKGQPFQIRLNKGGSEQDITFTPPDVQYPDSSGSVRAYYSDIEYDKTGRVHLAYLDRDDQTLKYSVRETNGLWSAIETIDPNSGAGYSPSIAIDTKGNVGIAYADSPRGDLKYARFRDGAWNVQTVDSKGTTGLYPSLAFTRKDSPTIAYHDRTKGDLRLAEATSTGWKLTTLDAGTVGNKDVGRYSQLALDPSRPTASKWVIFYQDNGGQRYRYAVQGNIANGEQRNGYSFFDVANSPKLGGYTSLAFDSMNRPGVSFYDAEISGLRYAKSSGDTYSGIDFSDSTVTSKGSVGLYTNIYFNGSDQPVIYYFDRTHNNVMRAIFSTKWTALPVVAGGREIHVARYNSSVAFSNLNQATQLLKVLFD